MSTENKVRSAGWRLRLMLLVLIGSWMVGSPAYRQIYKGKSTWFPRWVMFHGYARQLCDVKYYSAADDGSLQPLDRYKVLNRKRSWSENRTFMRLKSVKTVKSVARRMCSKLGADADVRAWARCAGYGRWRTKLKADENLCESKPVPLGAAKRRLR